MYSEGRLTFGNSGHRLKFGGPTFAADLVDKRSRKSSKTRVSSHDWSVRSYDVESSQKRQSWSSASEPAVGERLHQLGRRHEGPISTRERKRAAATLERRHVKTALERNQTRSAEDRYRAQGAQSSNVYAAWKDKCKIENDFVRSRGSETVHERVDFEKRTNGRRKEARILDTIFEKKSSRDENEYDEKNKFQYIRNILSRHALPSQYPTA